MISNPILLSSWKETLRILFHPQIITMLFLGLAAGLPYLLIFSTPSLWLREAGVERADVTFFSWALLCYSFKFAWAPLVDRLPLPILTYNFGRRRAWLLLSQFTVIVAIILMAITDPALPGGLIRIALAAILLGFSSATQDIVIDAFRIESAPADMQAMLSSSYIAGYRIGMLITGAGTLFLASILGSQLGSYQYSAWMLTYMIMAAIMLIGPITTLLVAEPVTGRAFDIDKPLSSYIGLLTVFIAAVMAFMGGFWSMGIIAVHFGSTAGSFIGEVLRLGMALLFAWFIVRLLVIFGLVESRTVDETYVAPIREFFQRYGTSTAWVLLALISVYRISDIILGVIANVFYLDMGFTKIEIASIVKTYGLLMTLLGGFLGGALTLRYGVIHMLFFGTTLSIGTHLLFLLLAQAGHHIPTLYFVISADNFSAGLGVAAFIAFISSLTSTSFTAVQYAVFSSIMTLFPKLLGGYSGTLVEVLGYQQFFLITSLLGVPVLLLVRRAQQLLAVHCALKCPGY